MTVDPLSEKLRALNVSPAPPQATARIYDFAMQRFLGKQLWLHRFTALAVGTNAVAYLLWVLSVVRFRL